MPAELAHPTLPVISHPPLPGLRSGALRPQPGGWRQAGAAWLLTLLVLLTGAITSAQAQGTPPPECSQDEKFINTWYFGFKAGLDFNQATDSIKPTVLTDGQMDAPAGSGVMSDANGSLLFYSNGETVWNRDHNIMPNGTGMGGNRLTTDGPLAIKKPGIVQPGGERRYYLFTQDAQGGPKGLSYSEIVIPAGSDLGDVVAATKNKPLAKGTTEKMTGVFHKNGCDIWVIVHGWGTATSGFDNRGDAFLAYRVRTTGVDETPIISKVGKLHAPSVAAQGFKGQMKVSPDGQQLAVARYSDTPGDSASTVELFAFDPETGIVSNPRVVDAKAGRYYGVEFSPSRSKLYATVLDPPQLLQFTIDTTDIPASKKVIPLKQTAKLGSMQAAPDGKIYVARDQQPALGFISYPDSIGAAIGFAEDSLLLETGRRSGLGLPNFNQSSLVRTGFTAQSTGCLQITFTAPPANYSPQTYLWSFGDGTTSTQQNPVHTFPTAREYTVKLRISTDCFCREATFLVPVPGAPTPGGIAGNQTLCAGATPAPLSSTAPAGAGTGEFTYQWQSSRNNSTWTDIGGANDLVYAPGVLPTGITYFRRLVTSGFCAPRTPTTSVAITVLPAVTTGSIAANQTVCVGNTPAPLTSVAPATGGTGTFVYQWESSVDNITWTPISGANAATYAPRALTVTTLFRRQVRSGTCPAPPSNTVTITVVPAVTAGSIAASQALCAGATAAPLTSETPATGGTGSFSYQWESSPNNSTWTAIAGATGPNYSPGRLTATTSFRRRVTSGSACAPAVSNVVTITVTPALTAGTIGAPQALCLGATPTRLTSTAAPTGGTGSYTYLWESSPNNSTWTPLAGATGATYQPGPLTATTYYRRQVSSGPCGPIASPSVAVTVLPTLRAGTIAANQDICAGTTPNPLTSSSLASGGTGTFAYQWESSTDNISWRAISGATSATYTPGSLTATTYYRRRVTSGTGTCATEVSNVVTIQVRPVVTPSVTLAAPPVQCAGTPLTFTAVPTNAGPAPTFRWLVNNVAVATGPTFTSSTLATGDVVKVEVTPTAGLCSARPAEASVTVTRTPTPAPTLSINVQPGGPVCPGDPLTFSLTNVTNPGPTPAYQWLVNGNPVAGATNPVFTSTTLREGQVVTLRLRTTNVCGQAVTAVSNPITARILPPVDVNAGPDKEILAGTSVVLEGQADGTYPVTWTPATGLVISPNDPLRPVASPLVTTTYTLSGGAGGCADSDQVTVTVRPPIRIPNAFTPNGDGRDDTWQIEFIEQFPDNTVSVFNRWGNRIFSVNGYNRSNEWKGDINGQPAPVGTYYYVVVTKGPLGKSYSGSITILY
ncbi:hypothetical protein GCM10027346_38480 [Hymenobacter seoulensis]